MIRIQYVIIGTLTIFDRTTFIAWLPVKRSWWKGGGYEDRCYVSSNGLSWTEADRERDAKPAIAQKLTKAWAEYKENRNEAKTS